MMQTIHTHRTCSMIGRRLLPGAMLGAALLMSGGCSRRQERFYEYDSGKINLERITYITPRIKAGVDEFPLTPAGIEKVTANLREGKYAFFDVQALIFFDDFAWRLYRSRTVDKDKPLTPADIAGIERDLKKALARYRAIR